jgi:hypothetical protein
MIARPENQRLSADEAIPKSGAVAMIEIEDDFGDEQLGQRQLEACSMEEGCIVCQ